MQADRKTYLCEIYVQNFFKSLRNLCDLYIK